MLMFDHAEIDGDPPARRFAFCYGYIPRPVDAIRR
jgi:hypothetical protein